MVSLSRERRFCLEGSERLVRRSSAGLLATEGGHRLHRKEGRQPTHTLWLKMAAQH